MGNDPLKKRKIAVLGSRSVGKSSLVVQFVQGHFVEAYYPTIENTFTKSIKHKNTEYDCDIIDTAGQDEYSILNNKHAIGIHGYILVYSVASRVSFDMIQIIHEKILTYSGTPKIPCVVVGQKSDLVNARQVPTAEGEKLATSLGCAFTEASARNNQNVAKVFDLCLAQIEESTNPAPDKPSSCVIM
ncbi:small monomeric GTPase RhbA [Ceratobasidium sp. AG-Ba]|nr:small monomeric GTPase RhbA [Ceratobasidium sp. AG-Ba]QRV91213.1 small monomeric GTPase RhbA [Ceratobasidium sp. AG-Ba]QRW05284.1 small monomeric GTPase RhbA [Ceratobasidium sp. AG-Ba]